MNRKCIILVISFGACFTIFSMVRDSAKEKALIPDEAFLNTIKEAAKPNFTPPRLRELVLARIVKFIHEANITGRRYMPAVPVADLQERLRDFYLQDSAVFWHGAFDRSLIVEKPLIVKSFMQAAKSPDKTFLFTFDEHQTCVYKLPENSSGIRLWCSLAGKPRAISLDNKYLILTLKKAFLLFNLETRTFLNLPENFDYENDLLEIKKNGEEIIVRKKFRGNVSHVCAADSYVFQRHNFDALYNKWCAHSLSDFVGFHEDSNGENFNFVSRGSFFAPISDRLIDTLCQYLNGKGISQGYHSYQSFHFSMTPSGNQTILWQCEDLPLAARIGNDLFPLYQSSLALFDFGKKDGAKIFSNRTMGSIRRVELSPNGRYALIWTGSGYTAGAFENKRIPKENLDMMKKCFYSTHVQLLDLVTEQAVTVLRGCPVLSLGFNKAGTDFYVLGCLDDFYIFDLKEVFKSVSYEQLLDLRDFHHQSQWVDTKKVISSPQVWKRFLAFQAGLTNYRIANLCACVFSYQEA